MAIIGPNFVFYHIPRTAGTSMRNALSKTVYIYAYDDDETLPTHAKDHGLGVPDYAIDYPSCCGVRNPYYRELSLFIRARDNETVSRAVQRMASYGFKTFLQRHDKWDEGESFYLRRVWGTQSGFLHGEQDNVKPDYKIHFEGLPQSFMLCPVFEHLKPVLNARLQENRSYDISDYYDDEAIELVRTYCADDFDFGGYSRRLPWLE